jgi:hypothetical protein
VDKEDDEIAHPLSYQFPKFQHFQRFVDFAEDTSPNTRTLFETKTPTAETIQTGNTITRFYEIADRQFREPDVILAEHRHRNVCASFLIDLFCKSASLPATKPYRVSEMGSL